MSNNGFITLHRKLLDWEWFADANTLQVFIYLLLKANHKSERWRGREIARGQVFTGRKSLAAQLGLSEKQVRTILKRLEKTGELRLQRANDGTLVTLVKYSSYQSREDAGASERASKGPSKGQQGATNNNDNNDNNKKKNIKKRKTWTPPDWINQSAFAEFEEHRREIRKPLSDLARTKAANTLKGFTYAEQQDAIDKTIQNRWAGLFPEKRHETNQQNNQSTKNGGGNREYIDLNSMDW